MLYNEARNQLVKTYKKSHDAKSTAAAYGVSVSTVYRLADQKAKTGNVDLRVSQRGRKPVLGEKDLARIARAIERRPDITLTELIGQLELTAGAETVRRAILAMGYRKEKKRIPISGQERPQRTGQARTMAWVCGKSTV